MDAIGQSVMISRPADTNFYACSARGRIRLQADVIVNRIAKTLLAPQVLLRCLNRNNPNRASDVCGGEDGAGDDRTQRWQGEVHHHNSSRVSNHRQGNL